MKMFKINPIFKKKTGNLIDMNLYQHTVSNVNVKNVFKQIEHVNKIKKIEHVNKIKKITHVYQLSYKNRETIFGLGDFIRGSFCLLQICNKHGIEFVIDVSNHPISNYIEGQIKNPNINYNKIKIEDCFKTTEDPSVDYKLITQMLKNINTKNYYTCANNFPFEIKQSEIEFIRNSLQPNYSMKTAIDEEMTTLNLISKQFSVIHIRSGDDFLVKNHILLQDFIEQIFERLTPILENNTNNFLILSDNNQLKELFKKYNNCVVQIKPITHLGEQPKLKDEEVKNTMLDFYLMSHSNYIYAITVYGHGTGFSKWCSVLYNIPYDITYKK